MTLQQRLDTLKAELASKVSADASAIMHDATTALKASGLVEKAIKVGQGAPSFVLPDADGVTFASEDCLARGPLVISFYRGLWCPYCNIELQALQETLSAFRARGAELVVISPQTAVNSRRSARTANLQFPILVDKGNVVAAEFGLRFRLPDNLIELYKRLGNNLALVNGDDSWTLPIPARFIVDRVGTVRYAEINPDYSVRPEPKDLLAVLDDIARTAGALPST